LCKDGEGGGDRQFDLICFSDVLHHCICPTYQETRDLQTTILKNAKTLLSPNGSIIVSERIVNSWLPYDYSTKLIYNLTRSKSIASIIKLLGANTAGVGVAFMSKERFKKLCNDAGLTIIEEFLITENKKNSIKSMLTTSVRYFGLGISSLTHRLFRLTIK
jgi:2-polyprenyl-3-methyl-5-hydroxy-6-metoxy-1,4-benzoquinol methylase